MVINVLNIPNFYSSYYLFGLQKEFKLQFKADNRFLQFNNKPLLIIELQGKIAIIDNDDPIAVIQELYDISDLYFVTNKLKDSLSYNQPKVRALFPHYPINILKLYSSLFGINLLRFLKFKDLAQQIFILWRRPTYKNKEFQKLTEKFVFFSSNIWKKEPITNNIRAVFIRFCKKESRIKFEGGFVSRSDKNNLGFDDVVNTIIYSPKTFSKLSSKSLVALNNPAVCDAVSWRLAEYLNQGLFVLSFPFKIELPQNFIDEKNICFIDTTEEFQSVFDEILKNNAYHENIARNGKKYFDQYCTPEAQANYIIDQLLVK